MRTTPPAAALSAVEDRVLEVVTELVGELRVAGPPTHAHLDDTLERDLGISSLERVELLVRLEQAFGVRLGDAAMADAETSRDLALAITCADPDAGDAIPAPRAETEAATAPPQAARTLVEALAWHVERTPDRVQIHLRADDGDETPLSYRWLWDEASRVARGLVGYGIRHRDTVAIMLRTEPAFFSAFFGTLMAGAVPVPLYPPFRADRIEEYARRQVGILQNAGARVMITFAEVERVAGMLVGQATEITTVATVDKLAAETGGAPRRVATDDPALIQYTSGSTGNPKGVLLSHDNLLANIRALQAGLAIGPHDVGVSWLPLYHDMGLIGAWLATMYCGTPLALMSPLAFLSRPARWLHTLHAYRGTLSPAPNFAYDLCAHRISDAELEGLDLSAVRVLLNGAEAVSADTLARFTSRFAPYGLDPGAVTPVYGLAECSVGLAVPPVGRTTRVDRIARTEFERTGRAAPISNDDATALRFVSCGRALPDHEVQVVDPNGVRMTERREGRVQFRGPSATAGYYRNPAATAELIGRDGWLETGDLGYVADGELFLTGRRKDLIITGGRNVHPHEVEEIVGDVSGVRTGCVAAFGVADPTRGTERFVIVAETRTSDAEERRAIQSAVIARVTDALGLAPDRVVLGPPGSVPKTSSGKIRRAATRDAFVTNRIDRRPPSLVGQWLRVFGIAAVAAGSRGARRFAQALYTAYVATVIMTTGLLTFGVMALGPRGRWIDRLVGRWTRLVLALAGCRVDITGRDRVPADEPCVLVANHASFVDAPLVMGLLPIGVRFAVKGRLSRYPILGMAIRKGGHIRIEKRDLSERIEGAGDFLAPLRTGESLFVFPEGTFDVAPRLLPFRLGAFRAAVDSGCPVVPVGIRGTRHIWPAETWLLRPGPITVTFGEPLRPARGDWPEIVRLRDETRAFIAEHVGEE